MPRVKKTKVHELSDAPVYATYVAQRWPDGRVLNVDGQMWRYFSVPLGPVVDALNYQDSMRMAEPLLRALEETVALTPMVRLTYRATAKSSFRHVHMLLVNLPRTFVPPASAALGDYHRLRFPRRTTYFRTLLFGIKLNPSDEAENLVQTVTNIVDTFVSGGNPLEMFTKDDREVSDGMRRAGLNTPTEEEMAAAEGWWNQGKDVNIPILPHLDHLHVFTTGDAAESAARLVRDNPELKCAHWPAIKDSHTLSFATVREFFDSNTRMNFIDAVSPFSHWASTLVSQDAVVISVRGRVEPAAVTASELRRQRRKYTEDINERYAQNKMSRADQEAMLQELAAMGSFYETGGTPTLIEASTIVVFSGRNDRTGFDPTEAGRVAGVNLTALNNLQYRAMAETMIGSSLRVNPFVRDLPAQTIGYSGLPNLSRVGDPDGALLGFTEGDEQPAYIHPMAATDEDNLPAMLVVGQTGAGKALRLSTSVPVPCSPRFPEGRATIGDLAAGDQIFGRDGRPYSVLGLSEIDHAPELFRLRLSDGQTLLADGNHQFVVSCDEGAADLAQVAVDLDVLDSLANTDPRARVSAADLLDLLGAHGVDWWSSQQALAASLRMVDADTVSDRPPSYIRHQALQGLSRRLRQQTSDNVGLAEGEMVLSVAEMRASGSSFSVALAAPVQGPPADLPDDAVEVGRRLARACAADNPRVPLGYMCASVEQRRGLWRGLCEARGDLQTAELATEGLVSDALRLARSLGFKASALRSSVVVDSSDWLSITAIDPVSPDDPDYGPVRCLTVGSPDHTYLVEDFVVTHNSMTMNWFADQFVRMRTSLGELTPVVLFDPKTGSDFSSVARMTNGRSYSLDELSQADGVFDALRFARSMDTAVEDAASVLIQVNPWGTTEAAKRWEPLLMAALRHGVSAGARSTMKALRIAQADGAAPPEMVAAVERVYGASPMFQALCGEDDTTPPLSAAEGLTYIKVGNNALNLPEPGALDPTLPQRVAMAMVRNIVYGSMSALQGREGVILLDEAWVFLSAGASEMQRLGRLARSMRVFPVMFTQRVSDALDAGLAGYISRGLILPITDRSEAVAACELFRLQATDERISRITAKASIGDSGSDSGAPNWNSMRALIDPATRQVLRGTIGIYADVKGRAVPTQVVIPPDFLAEISTNRLDELRRRSRQSATGQTEPDERVLPVSPVPFDDDDELDGW